MRFSVTSSRRPATPPPIFPSRKCVAKTSLPGTDHRIVKDRTGPDLDERSVYISMSPESGNCFGQLNPFLPLAAAQPLAIRSWPGPSTPGAPDVPAGCSSDAMPIRSLLSLISRNSPKRSGMVSSELINPDRASASLAWRVLTSLKRKRRPFPSPGMTFVCASGL